jgi:hypothetical protein
MVGLKDRPEVPKTGWKRIGDVEDLGAQIGTCEWDEKAIRTFTRCTIRNGGRLGLAAAAPI